HSPPIHPLLEFLFARVNRLELAAVDRNARFRQQTHLAAQGNELRADLLDGRAVVFAEIGDGFVIRNEPSRQPHHFQIAASLTLQPPARLDPVEIAIDIKLEHRRRMVSRPAGRCRGDAIEPQLAQFQRAASRTRTRASWSARGRCCARISRDCSIDASFIKSSFFEISSTVATRRLPIQHATGNATIIATRAVSINATLSTSFALAVFSSAITPLPCS